MKVFAVVDSKSACAEYFLAQCKEDALRVWFVMLRSSRPMFEFVDDYDLVEVRELPDVITPDASAIVFSGSNMRRMITEREENLKDAKAKV